MIVFTGENDTVLPFEVSRHVHERLDNAEYKIIPRTGHLGMLRDTVLTDMFETLLQMVNGGSEELEVIWRRSREYGIVNHQITFSNQLWSS